MSVLHRLLADFVPDPQNHAAMDWLARWGKEPDARPFSDRTVESRFSALLKEKEDGLRFFFSERARSRLLKEVLGVPDAAWADVEERVAQLLRPEDRAPNLVLDLVGIDGPLAEIFRAVRDQVLVHRCLFPVVLVVDPDQYDALPRSFDEFEHLTYTRVASVAEAQAKVEEVAGDSAVVASPRRRETAARWVALRWADGLEWLPRNAWGQLEQRGRLTPSVPTLDLAVVVAPAEEFELPEDGWARRALIESLPDPRSSAGVGTPGERVAMAAALGVVAAASEEEETEYRLEQERRRVEAELADLVEAAGLAAEPVEEEDVARARTQLTYVDGPPRLFRIGDRLHLLARQDVEVAPSERMTVEVVEPRVTEHQELREAICDLTWDGWRDDPFFNDVVEKLAGGDDVRLRRLLHARATLSYSELLKPKPRYRTREWRERLAKVLEADPAAALVTAEYHHDPRLLAVAGERDKLLEGRPRLLAITPAAPPLLERGQSLVTLAKRELSSDCVAHWERSSWERQDLDVLVPATKDAASSPLVWLQAVAGSPFLGGQEKVAEHSVKALRREPSSVESDLALPGRAWAQADAEVAMAWLGLRRAVKAHHALTLHDGRVFLEIGSGVVAEVTACGYDGGDAVRAAVRLTYHQQYGVAPTLRSSVATYSGVAGGYSVKMGFELPHELLIFGEGTSFSVRFLGSALLAAVSGEAPVQAVAGAVGGSLRASDDEDDY